MPERQFTVVDDSLRHAPAPGRPLAPWSVAVLEGRTVFLTGAQRSGVGGSWGTFRKHGFQLQTRRHELDGVKGLLVWAEKVEP